MATVAAVQRPFEVSGGGLHVAPPPVEMRILITDGNDRAALAATRSLVRAGHEVCVVAPTRASLAGASRGAWGRARVLPVDPLTDPAAYAVALGRVAVQERTELLLPITDPSLEAVLEHRDALPTDLALPFADLARYRSASDKLHVLGLAQSCGFATPQTQVLESPEQRRDGLSEALFPAVIKPHRSVVGRGSARRKLGVTHVADADECRRVLGELPAAAFPVMVQRRVSGVGEGLFALRWHGRAVALFAHRRLREKPPSGGVSVYRESIALDDRLAGPGLRLLDALDWRGVAMIECKRDPDTGRYFVMEVNARFWGSLQLAIDAGVDFPALLARCAAGESVPECREYRVGVRSRWFWGDVDHLVLRLRAGSSRLRAVTDFLRAGLPGLGRSEIWRWRDPLPFAIETLQWLGILARDTGGATRRSTAAPTESALDSAAP